MPMPTIVALRIAAPGSSSCTFMRRDARCTTWTSHPRFISPRAASSPRRPPPITTAFFAVAAPAMMALQSSSVRNPMMPGARSPFGRVMFLIGGMNERLPVAMISLSYGSTTPLVPSEPAWSPS